MIPTVRLPLGSAVRATENLHKLSSNIVPAQGLTFLGSLDYCEHLRPPLNTVRWHSVLNVVVLTE